MTPPRDESGFRPNMRVRLGVHGATGYLRHCESRAGRWYWKVKLDTGEWAWPEDLVIDGPGELVARCADCGLRFMCHRIEQLCPGCDERAFGTRQRAGEPAEPLGASRKYQRERGR